VSGSGGGGRGGSGSGGGGGHESGNGRGGGRGGIETCVAQDSRIGEEGEGGEGREGGGGKEEEGHLSRACACNEEWVGRGGREGRRGGGDAVCAATFQETDMSVLRVCMVWAKLSEKDQHQNQKLFSYQDKQHARWRAWQLIYIFASQNTPAPPIPVWRALMIPLTPARARVGA
jgi:hypothetical protein